MIHALKTKPKYFSDVANGKKTFEVRKFDRPFNVGDFLALNEFDPEKEYTGRCMIVQITYILSDTEFCKDGYVVLGIKPMAITSPEDRSLFGILVPRIPVYNNTQITGREG